MALKLHRLLWGTALVAAATGCATSRQVLDTPSRGLLQSSDPAKAMVQTPEKPLAAPGSQGEPGSKALVDSGFIWPVKQGTVSSFFGNRRRDFHEGIDIRSHRGSPIFASKAGLVIYSSRRIHGYGNMIVIRHDDSTSTVYAHNKKNAVRKGQHVEQGQLIGYVGATGKATGPHLHFEIRKGEQAEDPLNYLPQNRVPAFAHK